MTMNVRWCQRMIWKARMRTISRERAQKEVSMRVGHMPAAVDLPAILLPTPWAIPCRPERPAEGICPQEYGKVTLKLWRHPDPGRSTL